jgi:hypothetical protein
MGKEKACRTPDFIAGVTSTLQERQSHSNLEPAVLLPHITHRILFVGALAKEEQLTSMTIIWKK